MASDEMQRLNALRVDAGLDALRPDPDLAHAARQHASYLDRHREPGQTGQGSAHEQRQGRSGFSGATPGERALQAGYPHNLVLENVSMGYDDAGDAMDGLMGAIYHRLTFLDLSADEVGIAVGRRSRVFVLGRSDLAEVCMAPPNEALLQEAVDCLGQPMQRSQYEQLCTELPEQARFQAAHPIACPDGQRLNAKFMAAVCKAPPPAARFSGQGRYYRPCGDETRIGAAWFDQACSGAIPGVLHTASSRYYTLCNDTPGGGAAVQAEWLEGYCSALPKEARYTDSMRYRLPCAADHEIKVEFLDAQQHKRMREQPRLVVWPVDGARDIPPAFFDEEPDPLPDIDVSAYPVSIQVNPAHVKQVELRRFTLQRLSGEVLEDIGPMRLLDHRSDPNNILDTHEFALFPLRRLDWGTRYQASAELVLDGITERLRWTFTTRGDSWRPLIANADRQEFTIAAGTDYLLYLPPDANSVRFRVEATRCDRIKLRFDSGREVNLVSELCQG